MLPVESCVAVEQCHASFIPLDFSKRRKTHLMLQFTIIINGQEISVKSTSHKKLLSNRSPIFLKSDSLESLKKSFVNV